MILAARPSSDTIDYKDTTRSQTFTYDPLNRLTSAQNAGTNCAATTANGKTEYWGNSYNYDAWGNLLGKTITKCGAENLSVTADAHNWLHISPNDYHYDVAGNMTYDATENVNLSYDQENRITGAAGYTYTYDDDGNRVRKSNGNLAGNGTLYWYMTPGIVAETDLAGTTKSEYMFFGGERVARRDGVSGAGGVFYYFSDHLKTASVVTDSGGTIKAESDYYPWGGELQITANDSNHYKFTGKERDETGLDYFGARYYSNGLGRFVTPDWAATPVPVPFADLKDPQSLNQYAYVRNRPASVIDKDGHDLTVNGDEQKRYIANLQKASGLTVAADKNGKLSITKTPDKLSAVGKQIQKIIQDPKHHVQINALSKSPVSGTVGGHFYGNGTQTLDFKSIDQVSGKGGFTETSIIVHETTEAYAGTLNGGNFQASHAEAIGYENLQRIDEGAGGPRIGDSSKLTPSGPQAEINFSFSKERVTFDQTGAITNVTVERTNNEPNLPPQ